MDALQRSAVALLVAVAAAFAIDAATEPTGAQAPIGQPKIQIIR